MDPYQSSSLANKKVTVVGDNHSISFIWNNIIDIMSSFYWKCHFSLNEKCWIFCYIMGFSISLVLPDWSKMVKSQTTLKSVSEKIQLKYFSVGIMKWKQVQMRSIVLWTMYWIMVWRSFSTKLINLLITSMDGSKNIWNSNLIWIK